jgi:hypothetical protein
MPGERDPQQDDDARDEPADSWVAKSPTHAF